MGVVGNGDGLTRCGVDRCLIGNRQGQVVWQDNFQGLSLHRRGPVSYRLVGIGVHHLNGSGVQNQGIAQLVHQGDGIRPADQILAQLIQRDLKGIPAAIGFGVISALLGQRLFSDCHTIAVVADGRSLGILQADHIVELLAHAAQKNVRIRYLTDDLYLHGILVPLSASGYQIVNIPDHPLTVGVIVVRLGSRVDAWQGIHVFRPAAVQGGDFLSCELRKGGSGLLPSCFISQPPHTDIGYLHPIRDLLDHTVPPGQAALIVHMNLPGHIGTRSVQRACADALICARLDVRDGVAGTGIGKDTAQFLKDIFAAIQGLAGRVVVQPGGAVGGALQLIVIGKGVSFIGGQLTRLGLDNQIKGIILLQGNPLIQGQRQRRVVFLNGIVTAF